MRSGGLGVPGGPHRRPRVVGIGRRHSRAAGTCWPGRLWGPVLVRCPSHPHPPTTAGRVRSNAGASVGPGTSALRVLSAHQGWAGGEGNLGGSSCQDHDGAIVLQAWPELVWGWEGTKAAPPRLQLNTGPLSAGSPRPQPAGLGLLAHCVQRNTGDLRDPACLPRLQPLLQLQPRPRGSVCPKVLCSFHNISDWSWEKKFS